MGVKARPNRSGLPFWYRFVPHPLYRETMANPRSESGGGGGAVALHRVLQDCNLLEYEPLLLEEGLCPVLSGCVVCVRPAYVYVGAGVPLVRSVYDSDCGTVVGKKLSEVLWSFSPTTGANQPNYRAIVYHREPMCANVCQCVPLCTNVYQCVPLCAGADDVSQLKELDEEEFRQLCLMVGMATKPFHVKRFQKALGRPSSQIYSQKLLSTTTPTSSSSSSIGIVTQTVPPVRQSSNPRPIKSGAPPPGSVAAAPPVSQQRQQVARPPTSSLAVSFHSRHPQLTSPEDRFKQQHSQPHPQPHPQDTPTTNYRVNATVPTSLEKVRIPTEETVSPTLGYQSLEPALSAKTSSKQLFLPPYLQPDSETKDITSLVDELTPIQAELGPCPFKPSDWDERRAELVRRYAAIYGQGNSKRKHEELSLHEENINMAAFQLCLRDPTLLVRRDELLVLSRKAIKDGGYTFQHGLSKAKSGTLESIPSPSPSSVRKHSVETVSIDDGVAGGYPSGGMSDSLLPLPRNMSREKKLKRVEELEFLITKNKMKQTIKLTALEKARQANDFSMSHHLQAEIESLGNTLANLQEEYSNMKYRLRRSDRYFEKKRKLEEVEGRMAPPNNSAPLSHQPRELEVVPKRIRCIPEFSESEGPREQEHHLSAFYPEIDPPQVQRNGCGQATHTHNELSSTH